ncbi:MAG TPA: KTSC domain-containing protein [Verrucomicrobiae bacterium]|nr:KTSC domain-containing protein [Verrucomicrobiae bacterium]
MEGQSPQYKMAPVQADLLESVGFSDTTHTLYIKFRNSPALSFEKVPRFRYQGLMAAARKDAYFRTFIQNQFLSKPLPPPA